MLLAALCAERPGGASQDPLEGRRFDWRSALAQSGVFLGIQHGFRFATEPGTRTGLKGPFMRDWYGSVKGMKGWGDGDPFLVNYVGHPMMGAVTGYIQVQNDPRGRTRQFGLNSDYWRSRMKALGWSAAYSLQFEFGPASEASLGNVGLGGRGAGAVDLVVTPTLGLAWQCAEDALDRYVIAPLEDRTGNRLTRTLLRGVLNPSRSFSNMLRGKVPWYRDAREGIWGAP